MKILYHRDYMALSKAIIGLAQLKLMEILADAQNAVLFDPKVANGIAGAVTKLTSDAALQLTIGRKQVTWRENFFCAPELFKRIPKHA